jgi:Mn2+/Fe2+ NRAMP family transporter
MRETKKQTGMKKIFKMPGRGLIADASDDAPSGIATYPQAGAQFGFATLLTMTVAAVALIYFYLNDDRFMIQSYCTKQTVRLRYKAWLFVFILSAVAGRCCLSQTSGQQRG